MIMARCLNLALVLCLLFVLIINADTDNGSFLIFNENHNKCIKVERNSSITVAPCDPHAKGQQFRWASQWRIFSLSLKLCLGATDFKDRARVLLFDCDESSDLQRWECKNETLFGLKDHELHLNWGHTNEWNVMVHKDSGLWSRWMIFGTRGHLCSKGYDELFTIGGNAFGGPCQFPFKFGDKWYAECTRDGRTDGQLWCATDTDYNQKSRWGFCPTQVSPGWVTDPVAGVQYQLNAQASLTWRDARRSCQQQGADLLSITELHERSYISGLTNTFGTFLWIGLNSLGFESGWQWSNGNPFRYLNWAPGHPASEPEFTCATLNSAKASKWESTTCNKKLGYICRKQNSTRLHPLPPNAQPGFCPSHWVPYAGDCYYLERNTKKIWRDASSACHEEGGNLASIHNIEEQSFIISQSGYMPTDVLWIGLTDQRNQLLFEWSDDARVTFTQWQTGEPSHATNFQEDCVFITGKDGKWSDHMCDRRYGYICKKKASINPPEGFHEETNPGCKLGSIRFGSNCYNTGEEAKTFDDAQHVCSEAGGNLVDVINRYENAFLVSLVGLRPDKYFWIGFSNTEDRTTFKWTTRKKVAFTNFNVGMPDTTQGCVAMTTGLSAGLWDVISCNDKAKYICKKYAEGVPVTTVPPTTTTTLTCASGWSPVDTRDVCYKIYSKERDHKKTWHEAHDFCKAIGGDLMSIHSGQDITKAKSHHRRAWIGLNSLYSNRGFIWTDGSANDFENWGFLSPDNRNGYQYCVQVKPYIGWDWEDQRCDKYEDWICQINKGVTPKPEPVKTPIVYNTTGDGWIIHNDTHYLINTDRLSMEAAKAHCQKHFGELAAITGESERRFLWKLIEKGPGTQYYIGMVVNLDRSFSWLDGTPVTYTAWENNQPNFANNDENCVTMYTDMGYWNDINCGIELPSICKRSTSFINTTMAPTTVARGGCAPEWLTFQGKCYKIVVGNHKNWHDARMYCYNEGGNLVSITSVREQAFLTTQMIDYNENFWIGMNDITLERSFVWTDGKGLSYTNWAKGHPVQGPDGRYRVETFDCVVMEGSISQSKGLWKVVDCNSERAFICKKRIDSQILAPQTTVLPNDFFRLGNDSYKLVSQKMRWDEARKQCQMDGADLASILNPVSQAYITLQISEHNEPVWIGLNSNKTGGRFKWVDNWMLTYTQWGSDEPKNSDYCVYMDVDRKWKTAPCSNAYFPLCKKSSDIAPTEHPQLRGDCPESEEQTWIPFRGHCYSFITSVVDTWAHASVKCQKMGATLVSIQDPIESQFIQQNLVLLQGSATFFWTGLYKTNKGEWMWIDHSVVDYTNWKPGMLKWEKCADIDSESGQWRTYICELYRSYICKAPKVIKHKEKSTNVNITKEASHRSASITLAIVIFVTAVVGLGALLLLCRQIHTNALGETPFENLTQPPVDMEALVANMEQDIQL